MIIVGLTGSVASGKSTVAGWMRERGIAVHDSDEVVHSLLATNGPAVTEIIATFGPDIGTSDGGIDRRKLGEHVFTNPADLKKLESILHPLVRHHRDQFLKINSVLVVKLLSLMCHYMKLAVMDYAIM